MKTSVFPCCSLVLLVVLGTDAVGTGTSSPLERITTAVVREKHGVVHQPVPTFTAEVEVHVNGRKVWGRLIAEESGRLHLEHFDPLTAEWIGEHLNAVLISPKVPELPSGGWDARAEKRCKEARREVTHVCVGGFELPATIRVKAAPRGADANALPATGVLILSGHQFHGPAR